MAAILVNFLGGLFFGLLPGLLARFAVVRKPLKSGSANWIAAISVLPAVLAYQAFSELSDTEFRSIAGLLAIATFLLAKWIMHCRYKDGLAKRIRQRLEDATLSSTEREQLLAALAKVEK